MTTPTTPEDQLMSWLYDAHAMERQAVEALEMQVDRLGDYPELQTQVREHIELSRRQADMVQGCIERRGSDVSPMQQGAARITGNLPMFQGILSGDRAAKVGVADYTFEHFEIASYRILIAAAEEVGDRETQRVCEQILRQEEAMADWLARRLPEIARQQLRRTGAR